MDQYVYHFRREGFQGTTLYPLNRLKDIYPDVHAKEVAKYKGREWLLEERIPILKCLWNDVLHFSPVNPQIILDTWRREGLYDYARGEGGEFQVFRIPARLIDQDNTMCFRSWNFDFAHMDPAREKFWKFEHTTFREELEIDPHQIRVWHEDRRAGRKLFWYSHTTHVLARQTIDSAQCELIVCR